MLTLARRDDGQELVECAIILPLFLLLLLGILEVGIVMYTQNTLANAAREGARYGTVYPEDAGGIEAEVRSRTTGLDQDALEVASSIVGSAIRVELDYSYTLVTGLVAAAFGGSQSFQLHAVATMQSE